MASAVSEAAASEGWTIVRTFDSEHPLTSVRDREELGNVSAVIDFSSPDVTREHIDMCLGWEIPLVLGTTGVQLSFERIRAEVEERRGSMLYSPNFSLGIMILRRSMQVCLALGAHVSDFDVSIHEVHHREKRDRPSGTAKLLADDVRRSLPWKYSAGDELSEVINLPEGPDVSSSRVGTVFGEHTVRLEAPDDQITLSHVARSRRGFANGALRAARWLMGRTGFYTMDDMLDDWLGRSLQTTSNAVEY